MGTPFKYTEKMFPYVYYYTREEDRAIAPRFSGVRKVRAPQDRIPRVKRGFLNRKRTVPQRLDHPVGNTME